MNDHCFETTGEFLEITDVFKNVYPLITSPTRLTSNMTTLIDRTFTYNLNNVSVIGQMFVIYLTVLLFSHCFLIKIRTYSKTSRLSFRDKSANNVAKFKDRLAKVTWDELSEYNHPDYAYRCFLDQYTTIYNNCFRRKKSET